MSPVLVDVEHTLIQWHVELFELFERCQAALWSSECWCLNAP